MADVSLYDRAAILPGRSCTRSKAPNRVCRDWALSSEGAIVTAASGQTYLDLVCGLGAISLGYACNREFTDYWSHGVYSLPHECEVDAAEAVLRHVAPWATSVRFVKTGSESTTAAYRIAKAATGRKVVVRFEGSYHGWHEWCDHCEMWPVGEVPDGPYAAIFVEPARFAPVDRGWLQALRGACNRTGTLLVFDSMIYGGRWALGGTSQYFDVVPDLECFGKGLANGEAVAFVAGREALAEQGEIVSGTFSGDATGLTALLATLAVYTREPVIETLWARGRQLHAGLSHAIPASFATLSAPAPLFGITFTRQEDKTAFKDAMHARGILNYPDWWMTCFSHTEAQIQQVIETAGEVCRSLK